MPADLPSLNEIVNQYKADDPLEEASTPPSSWYIDKRIETLETESVFTNNWLIAARLDQLQDKGQYVATTISGEPVVIVKDDTIKAF